MRFPPAPTTVSGVSLLQLIGLLLPTVVVVWQDPAAHGTLFAVALITAIAWEVLFTAVRQQRLGMHGITTALIVAVFIPSSLAPWQLAVTVSLGVILAELVFGGRGFGFTAPATVALALLLISFPDVQLVEPSRALALATLPGTALLLIFGLISWRVILGSIFALTIVFALRGELINFEAVVIATIFGLTYLICDPTAASATPLGRWLYGALAGALIVLFSPEGGVAISGLVFAALLASIFAPLIDHLVILGAARRRRARCHV